MYGKSVGLRAPGMFVAQLRRTVASTGGTLIEVPTRQTRLSQFCHGCARHVKKPLSQRWHHCPCGVGPVQRDLYAAFLASTLSADHLIPSCAQAVIRLLKVRRRACRPRMHGCSNGQMRGSPCPEAWACPVPEPVGLKVWAKRRKSSFFSPEEDEWKRGSTAQNPRGLSQGSIQFEPPTEDEGVILYHQSQPLEEWIQQNIH